MSNLPVPAEALEALVEEIEAIVVEKVYESQNAKLELFWLTGEALRRYEREQNISITTLVQACANDNRLSGKQMGERNLFWALKIFDKFPLKEFPDDKAATLTKVKKMLTDGGEVSPCDHSELEDVHRCKACKKVV